MNRPRANIANGTDNTVMMTSIALRLNCGRLGIAFVFSEARVWPLMAFLLVGGGLPNAALNPDTATDFVSAYGRC